MLIVSARQGQHTAPPGEPEQELLALPVRLEMLALVGLVRSFVLASQVEDFNCCIAAACAPMVEFKAVGWEGVRAVRGETTLTWDFIDLPGRA